MPQQERQVKMPSTSDSGDCFKDKTPCVFRFSSEIVRTMPTASHASPENLSSKEVTGVRFELLAKQQLLGCKQDEKEAPVEGRPQFN
eukprot:3810834-Amphidinium_carterae.1